MFPYATQEHYNTLREELKNNNEPGVWVHVMCNKLAVDNPVIVEFLYRLMDRFGNYPWFSHAIHCACAMYRLLEYAARPGELPRVHPAIGAPMEVEMTRDWKKFQTDWIDRFKQENPKANSVLADYAYEYLRRSGAEEAYFVGWAGVVVYQYLRRQYDADEMQQHMLPLG